MAKLQTFKANRLQTLNVNRLPTAKANKTKWGEGRGRPWRRLRDQILLRDQYTCRSCGVVTMELEVDHILNRAEGGTDDPENLQSLCIPCHKLKTHKESLVGRGLHSKMYE